ncbi:hypothetical protein CLV59_10647 [Chitinophaga dinghuensis]|uniref:Uncharacterized protein n=2 Tax=Chitinophaga dinghuensis TaxID=1539050 RepID=A0A327VSH2_9BACT|nr:hypothetical protein CLV59_10647 [Chitinophaga dinghuensis]
MWMITIILGVAAFKEIDFRNLAFRHTGLGILYLLTFCLSLVIIFNKKRWDDKNAKKTN